MFNILVLKGNLMLKKRNVFKTYRRKQLKKSRIKKFLTFIFAITSFTSIIIISFFLITYFKTQDLLSLIRITKISVSRNETTVPSELIIKKFLEEKVNIFTIKKTKNKLTKMFPEIKDIKFKFISPKNFSIKINSQIPIFVFNDSNKKKFVSLEGKIFWVYDLTKFNYDNVIELVQEKFVETNFIKSLYEYLAEIEKIKLIKKICFKLNGEIIIETISGNKIIIDKNILKTEKSLVSKVFDISQEENVDIYARDLESKKLYVKIPH
jgi:cell division septal protein FtsQ